MNKILIATSNNGKFKEISSLLDQININSTKITQKIPEPIEDGDDFQQNATIKAKYYGNYFNQIALADDSGISVPDLDNQPGIHSARFAVNPATNQRDFPFAFEKLAKMLEKIGKNPIKEQINAYFTCNLALFNPFINQIINFEGRVDGILTYPARGQKGFGFDPIFTKNGMDKTFGQIDPDFKDTISHRSIAFKKLTSFLSQNNDIFRSI